MEPMEILLQHIRTRVQITKEIEEAILAAGEVKQLTKNDQLLESGRTARYLYFIGQGAARTYYYHNGKDVTSWIYGENFFVTAWKSFISQTPAHDYIELLEDSEVYAISREALNELYDTYPAMQKFGRLLVEEQIAFIDVFYKGFMFMSAREKYQLLLTQFPGVIQRVNLGYIASFLGITQETLSRIRRK